MLYGERLQIAIKRREDQIGRKITRLELSKVADCSRQNIGMILTNSIKKDQKLSSESHSAVASFLKVNPDWLLSETGSIDPPNSVNAPSDLSAAAIELAALFDMIPASDRISRAQAFNSASTVVMQALKSSLAKDQSTPGTEKQ